MIIVVLVQINQYN